MGEEMLHVKQHKPEVFQQAVDKALKYIMDRHGIRTEAEELDQFRTFYSMIYADCGIAADHERIETLANEEVFDVGKFIWFDDVVPMMDLWREHYTLGVVSDTWPSMDRVFRAYGLRDYFATFVMSCDYGVTKSQPTLFQVALDELKIKPEQAVFIDDLEPNLVVAADLGIHSIRIDRYGPNGDSRFPIIQTLEDLKPLLDGRR